MFSSTPQFATSRWFGSVAASLALLAFAGGCEVKSFIDPTELVDPKPNQHLIVPIVSYIDAHEEADTDMFASAVDPMPDDLLPTQGDYRIGPDDDLTITISDLQGPGTESVKLVRVTESGNISLPFLPQIQASGLTEAQLEQDIAQRYKDARLIEQAQVSVQVTGALNRTFSIGGAVVQPGEYPIDHADYRILDAIAAGREVPNEAGIEYIYVVRKLKPGETLNSAPATLEPAATQPTSPDILNPHGQGPAAAGTPIMAVAEGQMAGDNPTTQPSDSAQPTTQPANTEGRFVVVDGKAQPAESGEATTSQATTNAEMPASGPAMAMPRNEKFRFADMKIPSNQKIIRIPYERLRRGELQFNLVIRPGDFINVPYPPIGTFQVGGHVARPGSYNLQPKNTVMDAIIAAGMLDQVAIPERTQLIRTLPGDRKLFCRINLEKIFVGEQSDIYLKANDEILVGTNLIAPFIAAIRNGYRITYGFGFLYDRNYWNPSTNNNGGGGGG